MFAAPRNAMDTAVASTTVAGPSSEVTTPAAYEDDARHFAITASQLPKAAGFMAPLPPPAPGLAPDIAVKDGKSIGTRFHEDCHETDLPSPRLRSSRLFKGKGKEAVKVEKERKKPLQLLDLPVDILKDIVKEVTHTNDLTSLALCHSALHRLAIPHIYSRFDIVWPDTNTHSEPRSGVDALTYGLATLVMAEEIFGEAPDQRQSQNNRFAPAKSGRATETAIRRRRGNHYAHFTRKFSLGNGPADWVQEYLITKEGGKMLGTLVALSVARMRSLETFIWDMPTGILRDVWLALSSLGDRNDGQPCRLEKLWVRWHDNSSPDTANPVPPPPPMNATHAAQPPLQHGQVHLVSRFAHPQIEPTALDHVEHPSFSVLPPLRSLSVLDIDELSYLDEMAVLIGRSLDKLRELRVGIANHAMAEDWVKVYEGDNLRQVDPDFPTAGSLTIGELRLGGVLGTLTGLVCDMRKRKIVLPDRTKRRTQSSAASEKAEAPIRPAEPRTDSDTDMSEGATILTPSEGASGITSLQDMMPDMSSVEEAVPASTSRQDPLNTEGVQDPLVAMSRHASPEPSTMPLPLADDSAEPLATEEEFVEALDSSEPEVPLLDKVMQLDSLELERVPLSIPVMQKAIDWSRLTSLTLLHCQNHEQLWKTLRRTHAPVPKSPMYPLARRTSTATPKKGSKHTSAAAEVELQYSLKLKKIHTNTVSPALISFLKETLAPNSLEVLFLQEARSYSSPVTIDAIFKGPLRRHRQSLKKLLIDSSEKGADGLPTNSSRWRRWMLNRDVLAFVCSGKMPCLRELGMAIDYRDWVSCPKSTPIQSLKANIRTALLRPKPAQRAPAPLPLHPLHRRPRPRPQRRPPRPRPANREYRLLQA